MAEKEKKKEACEKAFKEPCKHSFVVTGWSNKGVYQLATQVRCAHCLVVGCLEELENKEWREKQGI